MPRFFDTIGKRSLLLAFTVLAFSITLVADVYRPADGQKHPVLLTRTRYNKGPHGPQRYEGRPRGFIVVIQDTRRRYNSDGEWYPFKHESADGYDAVEWGLDLERPDILRKIAIRARTWINWLYSIPF